MTNLTNYDPLASKPVTRARIDIARRAAESIVIVGGKGLQFDLTSRQRISDVIGGLEEDGVVSWRFLDNSEVAMTRAELVEMRRLAEAAVTARIKLVYERAQILKARLDAGELVTERDIHLDSWK